MLYAGCAAHYLREPRGWLPYSAALRAMLIDELGIDGTGVLGDVGCGPGVLAVQLAAHFDAAIGIDPDAAVLAEADRHARAAGFATTPR